MYRFLVGSAAAWEISVAIAFFLGCIAAFFMGHGAWQFLYDALSGQKDALGVLFFVGGTSAAAAAVVAFLVEAVIGWPLYAVSGKLRNGSPQLYGLAGLIIALAVSGIILALQQNLIIDTPATSFCFPFIAILIAGPIATLTFRTVNNKILLVKPRQYVLVGYSIALSVSGILLTLQNIILPHTGIIFRIIIFAIWLLFVIIILILGLIVAFNQND
jgi:hypothetical protein